jgi:DNA invertase Pin-like site-specific DNA recombinase
MLDYVREDDTVYVEEFSRLGRSTADLLSIVQQLEDAGVKFVSIKEKFDTKTPAGKLQMTMMAAIAEFERAMILERQREGIAIAKRAGKYKGRKAVSIPNIGEYYDRYMSRQGTKTSIAAELGISRTTLDKLFREYKSDSAK